MTFLERFSHLGRNWSIWIDPVTDSYFVRDDIGVFTGPYSTPRDAREWVLEIVS